MARFRGKIVEWGDFSDLVDVGGSTGLKSDLQARQSGNHFQLSFVRINLFAFRDRTFFMLTSMQRFRLSPGTTDSRTPTSRALEKPQKFGNLINLRQTRS